MKSTHAIRFVLALVPLWLSPAAVANEVPEIRLVIRDHRFEPAELVVPAATKFKLLVDNQDATAEEFESYELNREKIVGPKATITVWIGPLEPGRYPFFGEFNPQTAQGAMIAR
jgi:hypothetical protein